MLMKIYDIEFLGFRFQVGAKDGPGRMWMSRGDEMKFLRNKDVAELTRMIDNWFDEVE